jgi:hypothetical protein
LGRFFHGEGIGLSVSPRFAFFLRRRSDVAALDPLKERTR